MNRRQRFEHFAFYRVGKDSMVRKADGTYRCIFAQTAWVFWQAAERGVEQAQAPRAMSEAPRDGTPIDAWHVTHGCWITVRHRRAGEYSDKHCPWIEATGANSWPTCAFSVFRDPMPDPHDSRG